jgi:hypothetical protein
MMEHTPAQRSERKKQEQVLFELRTRVQEKHNVIDSSKIKKQVSRVVPSCSCAASSPLHTPLV